MSGPCDIVALMVEERPPGEIEDISGTPPATPEPPPALVTTSDDAASTPSVTTAMRLALNGSMALFTVSVVAPVLMAAWAVVVAAGIGLGAFVLLHAGALEPGTLQPASAIVKSAMTKNHLEIFMLRLLGAIGCWRRTGAGATTSIELVRSRCR